MVFTLAFIQLFFWYVYLAAPLLLFLCFIIVVLGQIVGRVERWKQFDALYWSLITATTVGYGDIRPLTKIAKTFSVFIALVGMMFTGILVAITVNTATIAFETHIDMSFIKEICE